MAFGNIAQVAVFADIIVTTPILYCVATITPMLMSNTVVVTGPLLHCVDAMCILDVTALLL